MCTLSFDSGEIEVLCDAVYELYLNSNHALLSMPPDEFGTPHESLWRKRLEICKVLLVKLNDDLPF